MSIRKWLVGAALALLLLAAFRGSSKAAPGDLDLGFGGFGVGGTIADLGFDVRAVAVDAAGRVVLVGQRSVPQDVGGPREEIHVQRRGGPHFSTVEDRDIVVAGATASADARGVAIAPDGKIVVVGVSTPGAGEFYYNDRRTILRFDPDLNLDDGFGTHGVVRDNDFGDDAGAVAVAVAPDLRIVVAGGIYRKGTPGGAMGVGRYSADGTFDLTFHGGVTWYPPDLGGMSTSASAVTLQGDKIVLAGTVSKASGEVFVLARLNGDGSTDTDFGDGGTALTDFGDVGSPRSVAAVPGGKLLVAGGQQAIRVARYLSDGSLDASFGGDGKLVPAVDGTVRGIGAFVQPDGKILVVGQHTTASFVPDQLVELRYQDDGTVDQDFGASGAVYVPFTGNLPHTNGLAAAALQVDGSLVGVGGAEAVRLRSDGSLDAGGVLNVVLDPEQAQGIANGLAVQSDGALVAAGTVQVGARAEDLALVRFQTDLSGALDTGFGGGAVPGTTVFGTPLGEQGNAVAIQGDQNILVAGTLNGDFLLSRFDVHGMPDPSCGFGGYNVQDFGYGTDIGRAVGAGYNGIYVAGTVAGPSGFDYGLARFNYRDCTLDTGLGLQRVDFGPEDAAVGLVVQTGRIRPIGVPETEVLAGTVNNGFGTDIALTRIANASPIIHGAPVVPRDVDGTFGTQGKTIFDTGYDESAGGMVKQPDGKLLVAGRTPSIDSVNMILARFSGNGVLDPTFGDNGLAYANFGTKLLEVGAVAVRDDGTIAVVGCVPDRFGMVFAVAQFTATGQPDTSLHGSGTVTVPIATGGAACARAAAFVGHDDLLVAGYASWASRSNFTVVALETTPDPLVSTTTTSTSTSTSVTSTTSSTSTTSTTTTTSTSTTRTTTTTHPPTTSTTLHPTTTTSTSTTTTVATSTTSTTAPREICGDCIDNDGNGLTDFEDPACCAQPQAAGMVLKAAKLTPAGSRTRLKLKATLTTLGLGRTAPPAQDVFLQLRQPGSAELLCAHIPAASLVGKKRGVRFHDTAHTVASAEGLDKLTLAAPKHGGGRLLVSGRQVAATLPLAGVADVTLGLRDATGGASWCAAVSATFRAVKKGALQAP